MELRELLNLMEEFELALADMYRRFSRVLGDDPEAVALFERLAEEEVRHAEAVAETRSSVRELRLPEIAPLDLDGAAIRQATDRILSQMRQPPPADLVELLNRAATLEQFALERHGPVLLSRMAHPLGLLLEHLRGGDRDHLESIHRFGGARGLMV